MCSCFSFLVQVGPGGHTSSHEHPHFSFAENWALRGGRLAQAAWVLKSNRLRYFQVGGRRTKGTKGEPVQSPRPMKTNRSRPESVSVRRHEGRCEVVVGWKMHAAKRQDSYFSRLEELGGLSEGNFTTLLLRQM